jgi:DNA polymerase V
MNQLQMAVGPGSGTINHAPVKLNNPSTARVMAKAPKPVALVDCNNFYASCERVFNPALRGRPVIVLSNNDGCVIARSNEAKELKIKMGQPVFQIKNLIEEHNIEVWSSNYALYASLSQRVMTTLQMFAPEVEVYSIDEAFLWLPGFSPAELDKQAAEIRSTVGKWTGIPVSVGLAQTKTLAKLANRQAKKNPLYKDLGVFNIVEYTKSQLDDLLSKVEVEDIWGIGPRRSQFLRHHGILTAYDLKEAPDRWLLKNLTITGLRTALELRGQPCLPPELSPPPKKTIVTSKAFGRPVESLEELSEAVATYVSRLAEKLRVQHSLASVLEVFIHTSHFATKGPRYANSITIRLPQPTAYTPELAAQARLGLEKIYRPGFKYQKAGVIVLDLVPENGRQLNLFGEGEGGPATLDRNQKLMEAVDEINRKMGRNTVRLGAAGFKEAWGMRRGNLSQHYTTRWDELLTV